MNQHEGLGQLNPGGRRNRDDLVNPHDGDNVATSGADAALMTGIGQSVLRSHAFLIMRYGRMAVRGMVMRIGRPRFMMRVRLRRWQSLSFGLYMLRAHAAKQHGGRGNSLYGNRDHQQPSEQKAQAQHVRNYRQAGKFDRRLRNGPD